MTGQRKLWTRGRKHPVDTVGKYVSLVGVNVILVGAGTGSLVGYNEGFAGSEDGRDSRVVVMS
jgi:hypothetical protein